MVSPSTPCTVRHLDHTAIAVSNLEEAMQLYHELFGVPRGEIEEVPDQGVRATLVQVGGTRLELIQPIDPQNAIARFIERRGEALHHVCFQVDGLQGKLDALVAHGVALVDTKPRKGLAGMIAFLHPRSTRGVLIELVEKEG